ncbi:histidine--tRNA ligase [Guyparkeria hydrothermalis]|uniref:histidine--tRNA ligase n=1 Tax=Guyparkeria TaxID=2035712 RepID=UPI0010ACAB03|nr:MULTISPECIES: histidine--tRNA ligase [Guyparkeria]MCL7751013.1 histidine--tRNA ligase [Guyparkeria hydrothermalis]TKA88405.1 histidine--tRNA ligase [Guyparkeria sp. SB14A]
MSKTPKSIRGMHDVLPDDTPAWQRLETALRETAAAYGYEEIRMPIVEQTALFARSIGEVTDIVEKEMYTFDDRNGDSLTLRPEGTAGCVRACLQHGIIHNQQRRLWYTGPMFRHERPQKGRYRQFHQFGVETFGVAGPELEIELIQMAASLWQRLGIEDVRLEINTLGQPEARARHREVLIEYLEGHADQLDEEARRRLHENPLRVLDSKNPEIQPILEAAPKLADYLDEESAADFAKTRELLDALGIPYRVNPRLVRGLDYYNKLVFEWVTESLGAQGTICAGGRYDGLVEQLGGRATPAAGFAIGIERLLSLADTPTDTGRADVYVIVPETGRQGAALRLADRLRRTLAGQRVQCNLDGGGLKAQFKRADRSGAGTAVIIEDEAGERVSVKPLRGEGEQQTVAASDLDTLLAANQHA